MSNVKRILLLERNDFARSDWLCLQPALASSCLLCCNPCRPDTIASKMWDVLRKELPEELCKGLPGGNLAPRAFIETLTRYVFKYCELSFLFAFGWCRSVAQLVSHLLLRKHIVCGVRDAQKGRPLLSYV